MNKKEAFKKLEVVTFAIIRMVPRAGIEPARLLGRGILNPLCLPISPPRRHIY